MRIWKMRCALRPRALFVSGIRVDCQTNENGISWAQRTGGVNTCTLLTTINDKAVSYTHLDVYKRQENRRSCLMS